ncbi:hypothetical protein BaRGS_00035280, partial [Batillaria attramentaria]
VLQMNDGWLVVTHSKRLSRLSLGCLGKGVQKNFSKELQEDLDGVRRSRALARVVSL